MGEKKKDSKSEGNLEKEKLSWRNQVPEPHIPKATVIQTAWYWPQNKSMLHDRKPEINPHIYGHLIYDK